MSEIEIKTGDLVQEHVDAIVNAWNINLLPWWLLVPQGVSKVIRKKAGIKPFQELRKFGILTAGQAVLTTPGRLENIKGIIHVAGLNAFWVATEYTVRLSTRNALYLAKDNRFESVAFPLIGAGTGGFAPDRSESIMVDEVRKADLDLEVRIIRFIHHAGKSCRQAE